MKQLLVSAAMILVASVRTHGAIIIDEFTDPAETISPEMADDRISTFNVGPTEAERRIAITAGNADPSGVMNVVADGRDVLTAELTALNPRPNINSKRAGIEAKYEYTDPFDFTQGGANDAFFIDFNRFRADVLPRFTRIIIFGGGGDGGGGWEAYLPSIPQQEEPFTLVFPFESFNVRGGIGGIPSFSQVWTLEWFVSFRSDGSENDLGLSMEIERVRVGRIPEPGTIVLVFTGLFSVWHLKRSFTLRSLD